MWIIAYFLLHFAIYSAFRVQFLIWNWSSLKNLSTQQIITAFFTGLRFDFAAVMATAGLFILGLLWFNRVRVLKALWFSFFVFLNVLFILVNSVDSELINFTGRRFSRTSMFLVGEGSIGNLIFPYLGIASLTFLLVGLYIWLHVYLYKKMQTPSGVLKRAGLSFAVLAIAVVAFRGGFQLKPMTIADSRLFADPMANNLVLNSTFTLLKSINQKSIERLHFFEKEEMLSHLNQVGHGPSTYDGHLKSMNVVIVILESFSKEYTTLRNPEFTPYFNQLSEEGILFERSYANARRSIEGIGAVLAGIPALMEAPFINSEFSTNDFIGLGHALAKKGYHSSFFHGARNGSMHFDAFAKSMGIQNYYGENEYPHKADHDGTWGIYDGPFLKWSCEQFSTFKEPFVSGIFTLSSHQPYNVPQDGVTRPEGAHPILKSIHYTDQALKEFMACAKNQKWFGNTLFIFTADHAGPSLDPQSSFESKFEIPILFYSVHATALAKLDAKQMAQQIDILPTVLETLDIERKSVNHLARSLWEPGPKIVPLYSDGIYKLVGDVKDEEKQLKAVRQYFSEGLFDNRLYYPVGSSTK